MTFPAPHPSCLWRGPDFTSKDDVAVDLDPSRVQATLDDVRRVAATKSLPEITSEDLPLSGLGDAILGALEILRNGRGFLILRGFPVDDLTQPEIEAFYWALGLRLGRPVSQSVMGDRLGHVRDVSGRDSNARAYRNSNELTPHTDPADFLSFLCLRPAASGGKSLFASAHTVHEEMRRTRPDLLEQLYRGYQWHRFGEQPSGFDPITPHRVPVFSERDGNLSCRIVRQYVEIAADEFPACAMDKNDIAALDLFDDLAARPDIGYWFTLARGEAVIANNFTVLHARTAFEDSGDETMKRHLLRLWLSADPPRSVVDEIFVYGVGEPGIPPRPGSEPFYENNVDVN